MPLTLFSSVSIKRKLVGVILTASLSVLAVTCGTLLVFEILNYRQATARSLSTIADIVAGNSSAALMFDDQSLAQELMSGLRADPEISRAALFDWENKLVAAYPANLQPVTFPSSHQAEVTLDLNEISIFRPVTQGDRQVGTVFIQGNLQGTYRRVGIFGLVLLAVMICSVLVAYLLSDYLQRVISAPVLSLAKTAAQVTAEQDFSVRAAKISNDELGTLADSFNAMLDRIQSGHSALQESEERFRTLGDNMAQLAWMTDARGYASWYNKRWYDYTGASVEEVKDRGWENRQHPDHLERVKAGFDRCLSTGENWEDTFPIRGHDGEYRWFLSQALPIRSDDGRVARWFGTNTDVTEQRFAQQQLIEAHHKALQASRAKDDFLAALSHELRTPLSPVLLIASDAAQNPRFSPEAREHFETIRKNVELEARLIDDLLDLTSITRGKIALQRQVVDLNVVLADALATIQPDITAKQIEVVTDFATTPPATVGDPIRLQQVFWNLLKNAAKFTPERGRITLCTQVTADVVRITVQDTGIGMTSADLARVFAAFSQGEHAAPGSTHRFGGLGLGLAISRSLVELHGGQIVAESAGSDRGSTFGVTLPLAVGPVWVKRALPRAGTRDSTPPSAPSHGIARRVLLVEDHAPTRLALAALLQKRAYHVVTASSLIEARTAAANNDFQLLISDIGLPDGTGNDLMIDLKARGNIAGIALTGYGMEADVSESLRAGFLVHLTKPVSIAALEAALLKTMEMNHR